MAHLRANFRYSWLAALLLVTACTGEVGGTSRSEGPGGNPLPTGGPADEVFADPEALSPIVRRLTTDEYARTVRDVIGVTLPQQDLGLLPAARPIEGFVHVASGQTVSTDHVRAYSELARKIVRDGGFTAFIDAHADCRDSTRACGQSFIASAGAVIFRRPPAQSQAEAFGALFDSLIAEEPNFEEAARATTEAMLQSPGFLYLLQNETEGRSTRTLDAYEMASRLSYFLWGSAPDEALYEAAAAGELAQSDGIEAQALRMLEDRQRVQEGLARFVVDWARLQSLPDDDGLKGDRIAAAVAYYTDRVESGADLFALYGDGRVFFTPPLAEAYGLQAQGDGMREYTLPMGMGPGGLLGQPGIVAGMTNADGGEIVARGLFLMGQLFCETPPSFLASLQEDIDEFIAEQPDDASDRQIADTRLLRDTCAGCHSSFDPLAYGFEQFDYLGAFRTADEFGNVLTTDGWIPALLADDPRDVPYADTDEYMGLLAQSLKVRRCLAEHQTEFALGLKVGRGQERAVAEIGAAAQAGDGSHDSLVLAIVTHEVFRTAAVVP